jgi:protein TonB
VLLFVSLDRDGAVQELSVKHSSGFDRLDQAALRTVRRWKFKPTRIAGIAVADHVEVPIRFVLQDSSE